MRQKNTGRMGEFCKHAIADSFSLDEEIDAIKAENIELSKTLASIQTELSQMRFQLLLILNPIL